MNTLIFFLLISVNAFCMTEDEAHSANRIDDYRIDWKYNAGEYFVFDCERDHYACVSLEGNENCAQERAFAIEKKVGFYPCAPLIKFATKKACLLRSYEIVDLNSPKRFCYPK